METMRLVKQQGDESPNKLASGDKEHVEQRHASNGNHFARVIFSSKNIFNNFQINAIH